MLLSWIAVLLLLGLYFAFANRWFVGWTKGFAADKHHGVLLALMLVIPYLLIALPSGRADPVGFLWGVGLMLAYILVPAVASAYRPAGATALHPLDILAILAIWFPIEFGWLPDVEAQLAAGVNIPVPLLTGVVLSFVCFLAIRPLSDVGYTFRLNRKDWPRMGSALGLYMVVGIPLGIITRFLIVQMAPFEPGQWVMAWVLGYFFTALPEEMLFRAVIQNQLHQRIKSEWMALGVAAVIFGLAHVNNATAGYPVPNWMYVIMATLAGLAYGWTWRKTGKITASAAVHATVNFVWGVLLGG
jgi:membrane protease YdiL (CAAX protease family)